MYFFPLYSNAVNVQHSLFKNSGVYIIGWRKELVSFFISSCVISSMGFEYYYILYTFRQVLYNIAEKLILYKFFQILFNFLIVFPSYVLQTLFQHLLLQVIGQLISLPDPLYVSTKQTSVIFFFQFNQFFIILKEGLYLEKVLKCFT